MAITAKGRVNREAANSTANATPLVLLTYTVPSGAVGIARVRVVGQKAATTVHYVIEYRALLKESAGTAQWTELTGGLAAYDIHASASTWVVAVAAATNTITVTVTGQAATTIDWRVTMDYDYLTNP